MAVNIALLILALPYTAVAQPTDQYETVRFTRRLLWDPASLEIADWQILDDPRDIVLTPFGDLIVADTGNARLVRFTPEGELIEIIGRRGAGPGEFLEPWGLDIDEETRMLWVLDSRASRITRHQLTEHGSMFVDDSPVHRPGLAGGGTMFAVWDEETYLVNRARGESRIELLDLDGERLASFGERFTPYETVFSEDHYQSGFLIPAGDKELYMVGVHEPRLERWTIDGTLQESVRFPFPGLEHRLRGERVTPTAMRVLCNDARAGDSSDRLFVWSVGGIWEMATRPFRILRRLDLESWPFAARFAVDDGGQEIRLFLLNRREAVVAAYGVAR